MAIGRPKTNNKHSVRLNNELHFKLTQYVETLDKHNIKKPNYKKNKFDKITAVDIVNKLLDDFFKNKIVSNNDYILFKQPFYYNMDDLTNNKEVEATIKEPNKTGNINILTEMPNNLDTFNKEFKSYCFNNLEHLHKGIQFIINPIYERSFKRLETNILLYECDLKDNTLNIYDIDFIDLDLLMDTEIFIKLRNNYRYEICLLKHLFKKPNTDILFDWFNSKNNLTYDDYTTHKTINKIPVIFENRNINNETEDIIDLTSNNIKYFKYNLVNYNFTKAVFNPEKYSLINFDLKKAYGINLKSQ